MAEAVAGFSKKPEMPVPASANPNANPFLRSKF